MTVRQLPIATDHLQRLVAQALIDLRRARRIGDAGAAGKAERRMNALLDQIRKRLVAV